MAKMFIMDYDKVYGFVNYGSMDENANGGRASKMRCKKCGAAWLDINYAGSRDTCPKCGAHGKRYITTIKQ